MNNILTYKGKNFRFSKLPLSECFELEHLGDLYLSNIKEPSFRTEFKLRVLEGVEVEVTPNNWVKMVRAIFDNHVDNVQLGADLVDGQLKFNGIDLANAKHLTDIEVVRAQAIADLQFQRWLANMVAITGPEMVELSKNIIKTAEKK